MIIPCPVNFWEVSRFPLTWGLIFINFFIYVVFFLGVSEKNNWSSFFSEQNMSLTGKVYYQYLLKAPNVEKAKLPEWVRKMKPESDYHYHSLAAWALRDTAFLREAPTVTLDGDAVALKSWQEKISHFKNSYFSQLVFKFGLSQMNKDTLAWVTYQFSHSSLLHLMSNMIYLLIIGTAVEAMLGSSALIGIYIFGGIFAGYMFLSVKSHGGAVPMIGASGSISALMAFYVLFEQRRFIRYVYLVSLHPRHHGNIYLPTLWIIPFFIVSDFAHHFSSVEGLGAGVAYTAHIGGTLFGLALAVVCRYFLAVKNSLLWSEIFPPPPEPERVVEDRFDDDDW